MGIEKGPLQPAMPLGEHCSKGPAVSRQRMTIAWTRHNAFYQGDIVYQDGTAPIAKKGDPAGVGRGILIFDLQMYEASKAR